MYTFEPVRKPIKKQKEVSPADNVLIPVQVHAGIFFPTHKQLIHSLLCRNFLERLLRVHDRQRNEDRARPRRNLVDIEPAPLGKKNDLRRNGGNRVPVVLPEETQIKLSIGVDGGYAAHFENLL